MKEIVISWDESGHTVTQGGNFLLIAASGYIGSLLWGVGMLYASTHKQLHYYFSALTGITILCFLVNFSSNIDQWIFFLCILWAFLFIILSIGYHKINPYLLYYTGGLTSMYALFDLTDFVNITHSDAGKIASYYIREPYLSKVFAYTIASLISIISIWVTIKMNVYLFRDHLSTKEYTPPTDIADIPSTSFNTSQ